MKNENGQEKSAILKGSTKYRDIDTGEFLETFEEGRNLELVSVKMPILTTSNEDGTKSNTLTVNEPIELRGIGDVQDTLDCLTGQVTERISKIVLDGSEKWTVNGDRKTAVSYMCNSIIGSLNANNIKCSEFPTRTDGGTNDVEMIRLSAQSGKIIIHILKSKVGIDVNTTVTNGDNASHFKQWLSKNPITVQYELTTESIKTVDLNILDQDNQSVERMKLFSNGHINTSSSTFPPILELKGIIHNNKLNMTTTNGTNNTQLTTLDNLALDGIICRDGTIVRDSYDVESGLYTKRIYRFTVDEEFIERYRNRWMVHHQNSTCFELRVDGNYTGLANAKNTISMYANNIQCIGVGDCNRLAINDKGNLYIRLLKEELTSYDVDGLLNWIKRNGAIEVAYAMDESQIIHMQPNMNPYVSTRPYQGSIESQGNILESSYLDYTSEQSIISPKPLGDGDVLRWEQGSQCYVYENDKEYIPLEDYNQPMGTVLDLEEEDGEQFVENLDGGDIIVDVPFKEKAVYERHLVPHEDNVIYPTQDKLDPTGKIEVDYICGATWQNPNDLADIRHVGTLRDDGQYDVTIRRSGDDEIRLMDGTTHLSLDGDGLNPSEFELTFLNSGGIEVGKYGDTNHTLEDCVLDSKLETGTVYGNSILNVLDELKQINGNFYSYDKNSGKITINRDDGRAWNALPNICSIVKPNTQYTIILYELNNFKSIQITFNSTASNLFVKSTSEPQVFTTLESTDRIAFKAFRTDTSKNGSFKMVILEGDHTNKSIPYFEGVGSTIVNGFTVSNSDDTEMVKYTLPTPITLNKVGDVVDTYDVVSGVETRNIGLFESKDLTVTAFETSNTYTEVVGFALISENLAVKNLANSFVVGLNIPTFNSDILANTEIQQAEEGIGFWNVSGSKTQFKVIIKKTRLTDKGYELSNKGAEQWVLNNQFTIYAQTYSPQTIQHTLIPSTVEMMQEPTFILPQPLRSVPNGICDRLYWDENKGHYCIEKRVFHYLVLFM